MNALKELLEEMKYSIIDKQQHRLRNTGLPSVEIEALNFLATEEENKALLVIDVKQKAIVGIHSRHMRAPALPIPVEVMEAAVALYRKIEAEQNADTVVS